MKNPLIVMKNPMLVDPDQGALTVAEAVPQARTGKTRKQLHVYPDRAVGLAYVLPLGTLEQAAVMEICLHPGFAKSGPGYTMGCTEKVELIVKICEKYGWEVVDAWPEVESTAGLIDIHYRLEKEFDS